MSANTEQRRQSKANWKIADPGNGGAIIVDRSGYVPIVTAAAESRSVADPSKPGLDLTLEMKTDGGNCTITFATAFTEAGDTTLVLTDPGQFARFYSIESGTSYVWRLYAADPSEASTITTLTATTGNITTVNATTVNTDGLTVSDYGTVPQSSSISTGVTLNKRCGTITTVSASLTAGASAVFQVQNSTVSAGDTVAVCVGNTTSAGTPVAHVLAVDNGVFTIALQNIHASTALNNTVPINFVVIKQSA